MKTLRCQLTMAILAVRSISFKEKRQLLKAMRDDETRAKMLQFANDAAAAAGIVAGTNEFDWSEFFDFLVWLVPLLLELIGNLE